MLELVVGTDGVILIDSLENAEAARLSKVLVTIRTDLEVPLSPLDPSADLFDAGFDSMSLARILVFVEQRYGVVIPDEDVVVDEVTTLDGMTHFIAGYLTK